MKDQKPSHILRLLGLLSFPSLLSCITLTLLSNTCIFAPMVHTTLGTSIVNNREGIEAFILQNDLSKSYIASLLAESRIQHDTVLWRPTLVASLYSTRIVNEFEFLDELGVSKFKSHTRQKEGPFLFKQIALNIMDTRLPLKIVRLFDDMRQWEPPVSISRSYSSCYNCQKVLRLIIIGLSFVSLAVNTIKFGSIHDVVTASVDIALILSSLSLIIALSVSQLKLSMDHFPILVSLLFLCFLCLLADFLEKLLATKFENLIEPPEKNDFSVSSAQYAAPYEPVSHNFELLSPSEDQFHRFPNVRRTQTSHELEDSMSFDLRLSPPTIEGSVSDIPILSRNLANASDFEMVLGEAHAHRLC